MPTMAAPVPARENLLSLGFSTAPPVGSFPHWDSQQLHQWRPSAKKETKAHRKSPRDKISPAPLLFHASYVPRLGSWEHWGTMSDQADVGRCQEEGVPAADEKEALRERKLAPPCVHEKSWEDRVSIRSTGSFSHVMGGETRLAFWVSLTWGTNIRKQCALGVCVLTEEASLERGRWE